MHRSQRNSPNVSQSGNRRTEQQRGYGGAGQPDYSLGEPNPYAYSYDDDDDSWRENNAQREMDHYRRDARSNYGSNYGERGGHERKGSAQRHGAEYEGMDYSYEARREPQQMNWRDAPEEWDRYAREQRGSAYDFYSGRGGASNYRGSSNRTQGNRNRWTQDQYDLSNFPDFNPPDDHYVYPGASRAWEGHSGQQQGRSRTSYQGYPYSRQDFERSWQHHPSHDQNEYAQRYGQSEERGAYGLSGDSSDNNRRYASTSNAMNENSMPQRSRSEYNRSGFSGRGPKDYERSDERIREDICERLGHNAHIDASEISVQVKGGVVTLEGMVDDRMQKHHAEDIADSCSGVKDVQNRINVSRRDLWDLSEPSRSDDQSQRQPRDAASKEAANTKDMGMGSDDNKTTTSNTQQNITRQ